MDDFGVSESACVWAWVETKNIGQHTAWTNGNPESFRTKKRRPGELPQAHVITFKVPEFR
jgi:hypothetical protein